MRRIERNYRLREWVDADGDEYPNFEQGGYYCRSYYSKRDESNTSFYGLEDSLETYDYDEAELWIWEHLQKGAYCKLETSSETLYFDPDVVEYGNEVYSIEDYQVVDESLHRQMRGRLRESKSNTVDVYIDKWGGYYNVRVVDRLPRNVRYICTDFDNFDNPLNIYENRDNDDVIGIFDK